MSTELWFHKTDKFHNIASTLQMFCLLNPQMNACEPNQRQLAVVLNGKNPTVFKFKDGKQY